MPPKKYDDQLSFPTTSDQVQRIDKWKNAKFGTDFHRAQALRQIVDRGLEILEKELKEEQEALANRRVEIL